MQISTDHIMLLLTFQEMDTRLGNDREKETEQVFTLLDVLKEEATARSLDVYTFMLQQQHPDAHPWSAIRAMDIAEFLDSASPMERKIQRTPPALFLILNRRPELEPNKAGDEVSFSDANGTAIWEALKNWSPNELKNRIGPEGWREKQFGIKLPSPKPKPGQLFNPPLAPIPRPPIPDPLDPNPPTDTAPQDPVDPAPPLDPVEPEPPDDTPPPVDEPPEDGPEGEPPEGKPPEDEPPLDDIEPDPTATKPWKEVGVTAAWAVGVGALAFYIGSRSST